MPREVPEWVGKTDDTPIPPRVKDRILARQGDNCSICGEPFGPKRRPEFDHIVALIAGGGNRESNIQALGPCCHRPKSARDMKLKAKIASVRAKHLGIEPKPRRRLPGGRDDRWKAKVGGGAVRRDE